MRLETCSFMFILLMFAGDKNVLGNQQWSTLLAVGIGDRDVKWE